MVNLKLSLTRQGVAFFAFRVNPFDTSRGCLEPLEHVKLNPLNTSRATSLTRQVDFRL